MSLVTMFDSLCTVKRPRNSQDEDAGLEQEFDVINSDIPCSYQEAGTSVGELYEQRNTMVSNTIYMAQDPETEVNDLIVVTLADGSTVNLLVQGEATPVARFVLWSVDCNRVRAPV